MKKAILAGVVLVVGLLGLWFYGRPAYRHYRETRSAQQAVSLMAKGDYRNASLSARQALQRNPRNLDACRVSAELADLSHSPLALDWRRRIAEVEPTFENRLMLARTALRVQESPYALAAQPLEELADSGKSLVSTTPSVPSWPSSSRTRARPLRALSKPAVWNPPMNCTS